ncbi:AraC family transcriptional regulator [Exiguobacterium sp. N4-1P]|uniref:AraC family transcriptional regulator n=1 Tax=Exiguobacterium sp. N4-1P TaxID=2051906 RepID=UPI000B595422|nr:AraC family transcriptional regulator [Exiguobacterium sp. N4-1P]ASI35609.1 AraC family transcriptional regulator [Exiguobacterium sp. N4-1P]
MTNEIEYGSYAFRFPEFVNDIVQIWSVGKDHQTSSLYQWNGLERRDKGSLIFQYTLSGTGQLRIDGKNYRLDPGHGFIVSVPSDFEYGVIEGEPDWTFIYITLQGEIANLCFTKLRKRFGPVVRFHPESEPIKRLTTIYDAAASDTISDGFQASALGYTFLMALETFLANPTDMLTDTPPSIARSLVYAHEHYADSLGIEDLATVARLSRYHFSRLFKKTVGMTPNHYITRLRVERAAALLTETSKTIDQIAKEIGYPNSNYFNKVFRKESSYSPSEFRKKKAQLSF